jgi:serine/threonine kinase 16
MVVYRIAGAAEEEGGIGGQGEEVHPHTTPNAFLIPGHDPRREVLLGDVIRALPSGLGPFQWRFRKNGGKNRMVELVNPADRVPVMRGVISAVVHQIGSPVRASRDAVKDASRRRASSLQRDFPDSSGGAGPSGSHAAQSTASTDRRLPAGGVSGGSSSSASVRRPSASTVDVIQINKTVGKAASGLWKLATNAAQWSMEQMALEDVQVGRHKVTKVKLLAEGGFSRVFLVKDAASKEVMALKQILCHEKSALEIAKRELLILRSVHHPNVVELLDHASQTSRQTPSAREFLLLFPFYARGTVWDAILHAQEDGRRPWPFSERDALHLFIDACAGCAALHAAGFTHRDVKPLNVLLRDDGRGVLMDVGSAAPRRQEVRTRQEARLLEEEAATHCTAPYRPPELYHVDPGMVIDEKVDTWSLGCTLYAMAFGHSPFENERDGVLRLAIMDGRFSFPQGRLHRGNSYSDGFCDIICSALKASPAERPGTGDLVSRALRLVH